MNFTFDLLWIKPVCYSSLNLPNIFLWFTASCKSHQMCQRQPPLWLTIRVGLFPPYNGKPTDEAFRNHKKGAMSTPLRPANTITVGDNCKTALSLLTFNMFSRLSPTSPLHLHPRPPWWDGQQIQKTACTFAWRPRLWCVRTVCKEVNSRSGADSPDSELAWQQRQVNVFAPRPDAMKNEQASASSLMKRGRGA